MYTLWLLGLLGGAILALSGYWWLRSRRLYKFRCPSCFQKLHYRARQAGHTGMCPRCGKHLRFPVPEK